MSKIAVVTDSVSCLPAELAREHGVTVAPIQMVWDRVTYRDGVDMTMAQFYARLRTSRTLPTTTSGIQGEFIRIFEGLRGKVDGVLVLTFSRDFGASYTSARTARELVPGLPVEIIDTRTVLMAQGFVVLAAARKARQGASLEAVAQAARDVMPRVHYFGMLDTLEYLRRGGRVSLPKALLAAWLQVKPIMTVVEGKMNLMDRVRTRAKALARLLELTESRLKPSGALHMAVLHGDALPEAGAFRAKLMARFAPVQMVTSEVSPVIGTHTGPGMLAVCFYNE